MIEAVAAPVWGDPAAGPNPPAARRATREADLCVVGLGGSGLAAVGAALDAGATVVGIDAGPIAGGAAGRNGGFLLAGGALFHHTAVEAWGEERAVGIYAESLAELDRLAAELGPIVRRVGSLRIPASDGGDRGLRAPARRARAPRLPRPARPTGRPARGVFIPGDGSVQPLERCRLLARARAGRAARGCTATRRRSSCRGRPRDDARGRRALPRGRGVRRRLAGAAAPRAGRAGALDAPADARDRAGRAAVGFPCPVYDNWGYEYWQQLPDGSVALGGGRGVHGDGEWGQEAEPGADVQALARPAAARARGRRRAGHAPLGRRDRVHGGPAAGVRGGPPGRDRGGRALGPRQRARLRRRRARRSRSRSGAPRRGSPGCSGPSGWD